MQRGVTQERVHDGDLDAVLQAVGGKAVTQAMDAAAVGQFGFSDGAIEDALASALVEGLERFDAREEIGFGLDLAVVVAQHAQEVFAEQGVALATALGMRDQQAVASAGAVLGEAERGFCKDQSTAIAHTEDRTGSTAGFVVNYDD